MIVGVDRIVVNGDVVNKIGIYNLVVLVKYYGVCFMVVVLISIFDLSILSGVDIFIEECDGYEVFEVKGVWMVLENV